MENSKWFLQSKAMIGALIVILVQFAPIIGFSFTEVDGQMVGQSADQILTGIGGLLALWGRTSARSTLTLLPKG